MSDFFAALCLALVLEGLAYAAFPEQMKRAIDAVLKTPNSTIRVFALAGAAAGLVLLWLVRGQG